ncbi:MAG: TetR/AcrR family transcriptional regulator [bacterium]
MRKKFKGERTRQLIIEKSTGLFTKNGYNHTTLSQILSATGLTKGGFYFHFKSKEELGVAVIKTLEECWTTEILPKMLQGKDAKEKLDFLFSYPGDCHCQSGNRPMILLLTLATEMIEVNDKFSKMLHQIYNGWIMMLASIIEEGKLENIFRKKIDAMDVASIILNNIMGANLIALLNGKVDLYEKQLSTLKNILFEGILQKSVPAEN